MSVLLGALAVLACLVSLASGQGACPSGNNPCQNKGKCVLKPDGVTPYCHCPVNYEGEFCSKFNRPRTGCLLTQRNFYGQKTGTFSSPNYPADYPTNQFCAFFIGTADARKFEVTFQDLALEKGKDELSLGAGDSVDLLGYDHLYDQTEYDPMPGPLVLEGDRVWFNFYSDFNVNNRGFRLSWRVDGDECLDNPCGTDETCMDGEYTYTCQAASGGSTGGHMTFGTGGTFESGSSGGATGNATGGGMTHGTGGTFESGFSGGAAGGTTGGSTGGGMTHGTGGTFESGSSGGAAGGATGGSTGGATGGGMTHGTGGTFESGSSGGAAGGATGGSTGGATGGGMTYGTGGTFESGATGGAAGGAAGNSTDWAAGGATGGSTGGSAGGATDGFVHGSTGGSTGGGAGAGMYSGGATGGGATGGSVSGGMTDGTGVSDEGGAAGGSAGSATGGASGGGAGGAAGDSSSGGATGGGSSGGGAGADGEGAVVAEGAGGVTGTDGQAEVAGARDCLIQDTTYKHGLEWEPSLCAYCNCNDGTAKCQYRVCPPARCRSPIKDAAACCYKCPPKRFIANGVSYSWGSSSGALISHRANARTVNVQVSNDMARSSLELAGSGLWKVGMYTTMKAAAGGGQISASEQILDPRKINKRYDEGAPLKFRRLRYNLDLTGRRCEDVEEVCVTFGKGGNPKPDYDLVAEPNPDVLTSCQAVECPPTPMDVTCRDEASGRVYQDGQEWSADPCTVCACRSGHTDCVTEQCPAMDCAETRPVEGQCCPECLVVMDGSCVYEGETRESGSSWSVSDCVSCNCDEGSVSCELFGCQCPVTPEEMKMCGGYRDGESWYENNCLKCTCAEGEVSCLGISCMELECAETVQGETDCCPRCKDDPPVEPLPCRQGDQSYYHGQQWKMTDCIECACSNGLTSCAGTECQPTDCVDAQVVEGECCLVCPDAPENKAGKPCMVDNRMYTHGDRWDVDVCTSCSCDSADVICAALACGIPLCPGRIVYDDPLTCCPYCDDTDTGPGFCVYRDTEILEGQSIKPDPCLECTCTNGLVDCVPILCLAICTEYDLVPGECCPVCADVPALLTGCSYEGERYAQGQSFGKDACTTCRCDGGLMTCVSSVCDSVPCSVDLVTPPDECCPVCPELFCTEPSSGRRVENGQRFKPGPCNTCTCQDGILSCAIQRCAPMPDTCSVSYIPDGECCEICADQETLVAGPSSCEYRGNTYAHGEQWRPDNCQFCSCANGSAICASPTCDLPCPAPLPPVAGQCCGSCPDDPRCLSEGIDYAHGERWQQGACEDCICIRGVTACKGPDCSVPNCPDPVVKPGDCCPTCPDAEEAGPPCVVKGNIYPSGAQFQRDPCTSCHCHEGAVQCLAVTCEPVTCANAFLVEGKCCLECPAEPCITKSTIRADGSAWDEDECTSCKCAQGAATCQTQTCPALDCTPVDVPGACCDQCPGDAPCVYNGKTYVKGQRFQPAACETCSCKAGGNVECASVSCPYLECSNPVRKEGQCCAECEEAGTCEFGGKEYQAGTTFDPSPCTRCQCSNSLAVTCTITECGVVDCPAPIILEGACCPTCEEKFCRYGGKVYAEGEQFKTTECSICSCNDGSIACVGIPCLQLDCPADAVILRPGQCCPTCPEPMASCVLDGESYTVGERWRVNECQECWCQSDGTFCANTACLEMPDCKTTETVEGQCCPVCTDPAPPVTLPQVCTSEAGLTYQDGARFYSNCGYCTCQRGAVSCVSDLCPPLACENQVVPHGACCAVCVEESKSCTLFGQTYQHRDVFKFNECVDCMCYENVIYCWPGVCRKPACDNPVKVEGKCCPECPVDPLVGPLAPEGCVLDDGRTYAHGTFFQTDPCIYCFCNAGNVICGREPCRAKVCDAQGEVTLPGECCSRCQSDIKKCVDGENTYTNDQRWRISQCKECYCDNGVTTCGDITCPEVTCADPVTEEGTCCPRCPTDAVGEPCTFDGVDYEEGQKWRRDKCTLCTCAEGTVKCTADPCPPLDCDDPLTVHGECCRVCPDNARPCDDDGKVYKHGESFRSNCLDCVCDNGLKVCDQTRCPDVTCRSGSALSVEGECCPQCPGDIKRSCTVDGVKYSDGQQWDRGNCETCRCKEGQLTCTLPPCPSVSCDNAVVLDGECCPTCPEDAKSCQMDGAEVAHGKSASRPGETCQRCSCNNGDLSCLTEDCPPADCDDPAAPSTGCCPTCPGAATCSHEGYEYVQGQGWQEDACTYCQCLDGSVLCEPEVCSDLTCAETVQADGECCPRCKDDAKVCTHNGVEYEHGAHWAGDECSRCTCQDGAVSCDYQSCPPASCPNPFKEPAQCCNSCPGDPQPCTTGRGVFSHGETWQQSKCVSCTCDDGSERCTTEQCQQLSCADTRRVEGECCRKCASETRSCSVDGVLHKHRDKWLPSLCRSCQCDDGTVDCVDQTCPILTCPEPLEVDNRCCPVCPGDPAYNTCSSDGQTYSHGQEWRTDACTTCSCSDGIVSCLQESCPPLQCQQGEPVTQKGTCCPICPEEAQPCEINGATYDHRQSWRDGDCSVCSCHNGQATCDFEQCTPPTCDNPTKLPGKCCLQCPDVIPARDCEYQSNFYPHSYRWNPEVCTQCNCNDGTVGCKAIQCPELACDAQDQVLLEGECCPYCPDQTEACVDEGGNVRQHGERWPVSDCTTCSCFDSDVACDTRRCPKPDCANVLPVDGQCCDECAGLPAKRPKDACVYRGQEYAPGVWWAVDDCKTCSCDNGITSCRFESCPRLSCDGEPIQEEGKCCPICPADAQSCTVDDMEYEHGQTWQPSVCTDCRCDNSAVTCSHEVCPEMACAQTMDVGQCCPQCQGDPAFNTCTYQGQEYKHSHVMSKGDCKSCKCEDWRWDCQNELCPDLTCTDPVTVEGECCKKCPEDAQSCEMDDETYEHGEAWSQGPCSDCRCDNGTAECELQACPTPDCSNAAVLEGECCPTCPGIAPMSACRAGSQRYKHGQWWSPNDCAQCTCMDGDISCLTDTCPRLTCQDPVVVEGECCKKCPDELDVCQLDGNGDVRQHKETWRVNDCQTCSCHDGKVACDTQTCPPLDCVEELVSVPEGQCCPVCLDAQLVAPLMARRCRLDGQTYQQGQRWADGPCRSCVCESGRVSCEGPACEALDCSEPIKVADECCLRCPDDARPCTTPDNEEYAHGQTWEEGACKTCRCNNGRRDCEETSCPTLDCSNPITVPDQCCRQCETRQFESCNYKGKEYPHGVRWDGKTDCTTCSCSDGRVDCYIKTCPATDCADPVKVKGQCCRVCVDDFASCVASDGTKRRHGEEWKDGDCVTCSCNHGTASCNRLTCPSLSCSPVVRDEGQCCPRCPTAPAPQTCLVEGGVEYLSGQSWPLGPCRSCSCDAGNTLCETETCSVLTCSKAETVEGECCKRCSDEIPICYATGGDTYKHGESWKPDDCTTCTCKEGTIVCTDQLCPKPACNNPVDVQGECCPQCPGVPVPKPCSLEGETRPHGDTWQVSPCRSCTCADGRVDCDSQVCPTLTCAETVKVDGECCRKCKEDTKDCPSQAGTPYEHGETWSTDACTTCSCYDGAAECTTSTCNPPTCDDPQEFPDECCPRCVGEPIPAPCQYEGSNVAHGTWLRVNSCKFCQCNNGIVSCASETCPLLTCPNSAKVPGKCCRICIDEPDSGCTVAGRRLQTGQTFRQSPCTTCTCFFGSLECDLTVCRPLTCDNPVKAHDECCPSCQGVAPPSSCSSQGQTYRSGESWTNGPCKTCFCEDGRSSCESQQCPASNCDEPVVVVDECCKKCPDQLKSCQSGNDTYEHATSFRRSDCETCDCKNGLISCQMELCRQTLDCAEPEARDGQCCDACPGAPLLKACTTKTGVKMRHGQMWQRSPCEVCTCDNGDVRCDKETCPPLACDQALKRAEGECCRNCPPDPANTCQDSDGVVYMPRQTWNPDSCTQCECTETGGIRCTTKECPDLDCSDPYTVEGQCCMTCDPAAAIKPLGYCTSTRREGDIWNPTPCAKCTCSLGEISCEVTTCKSLDCTDVIKLPGDCCARCASDVKKCRDSAGKVRQQGDRWRPTGCEECRCDGAQTVCQPLACDAEPACNNPQPSNDSCCPVCPGVVTAGCDMGGGRRLAHGEKAKLDECSTCSCDNGRADCTEEVCPATDCPSPIKREGECCSECPLLPGEGDCTFEGAVYRSSESFQDPADHCLLCVCNMGEIVCGQQGALCPPTDCPAPVIVEGECCPTCIEGVCEYNNKLYQSGEKWKPSDCEDCLCTGGVVSCSLMDCPAAPCSADPVTVPGRCCPECPDDYRTCMDKVGMYSHGQRWNKADDACVECFCDDSAICCEHVRCPEPECRDAVVPPGECCPVCGLAPTNCEYQNALYQHGETFEEGCSNCECAYGQVSCTRIGCEPAPCPNPRQDAGQCCPSCGTPCYHQNIVHQDGETWLDAAQPCLNCMCTNGLVACQVTVCAPLLCTEAVTKPGVCCPECPVMDITFGRARLELYGSINDYGLNFIIDVTDVQRAISGADMWRIRLWSAAKETGGGAKTAVVKQALNRAQASQVLGPGDTALRFDGLEYRRDLGGAACEDFRYVCLEFFMTRSAYDRYSTATTFGDAITMICLSGC